MQLFGNESLTSLVYVNIRHKLTGTWLIVHCYVIGQCLACYRRHQKCMNSRLSGQFDSCLFFIIQYCLINKRISVTSDIKKNKIVLFNYSGLKGLLRSTDIHKIDYTFLFLIFFLPQSNLEGGGCTALTWSESYI